MGGRMRVLVVGASGQLGRKVVGRLIREGDEVRAMTRDPARLSGLVGAVVVAGDLTDPPSLDAALTGVDAVVSTANSFFGRGRTHPDRVDLAGHRNLIAALQRRGVERLVFVSADVPERWRQIDFFACKHAIEQALQVSELDYRIIRAPAFLDVLAEVVLDPYVRQGRTTVFGAGDQPTNVIAIHDVAQLVVRILKDGAARREVIHLAGPANPTVRELLSDVERITGCRGKVVQIPAGALKVMATLLRPFHVVAHRLCLMGYLSATTASEGDAHQMLKRYPMSMISPYAFLVARYAGVEKGSTQGND